MYVEFTLLAALTKIITKKAKNIGNIREIDREDAKEAHFVYKINQ